MKLPVNRTYPQRVPLLVGANPVTQRRPLASVCLLVGSFTPSGPCDRAVEPENLRFSHPAIGEPFKLPTALVPHPLPFRQIRRGSWLSPGASCRSSYPDVEINRL
jgi:hypothetical protein